MASSAEFDSIVAEVLMNDEFFRGSAAERRERFRDLFEKLQTILLKSGEKGEQLA